jgi:hypothetical protein
MVYKACWTDDRSSTIHSERLDLVLRDILNGGRQLEACSTKALAFEIWQGKPSQAVRPVRQPAPSSKHVPLRSRGACRPVGSRDSAVVGPSSVFLLCSAVPTRQLALVWCPPLYFCTSLFLHARSIQGSNYSRIRNKRPSIVSVSLSSLPFLYESSSLFYYDPPQNVFLSETPFYSVSLWCAHGYCGCRG